MAEFLQGLMISPELQMYFVDKDSGEPLAAGEVTFYEDADRTTEKPIYQQVGSAGSYIYTELPNPLVLSAVGTVVNGDGNQVVPYLFPYEGTPTNSSGVQQLYYITVYSSGGVLQYTLAGFPNQNLSATSSGNNEFNFIPNGQFLAHTDIPASASSEAGEISETVTDIAQGGWTFEVLPSVSGSDFVTFVSTNGISSYDTNPEYYIKVKCDSAGTPTYKLLGIKFEDVNKFASDIITYSFGFQAELEAGSSLEVDLYLVKHYGDGGSATDYDPLGSLTITNAIEWITFPNLIFGENTGKTIGPNSYVQLAINFPNQTYDANLTNFVLLSSSNAVNQFPAQTNADMLTRGVAGWMNKPASDGSDLYLVPRLTKEGLVWDDSEIGDVIFESQTSIYVDNLHPTTNRMLANGAKYIASEYSDLGIPFSRLQSKYLPESTTTNIPMYGTGENYFTAIYGTSFGLTSSLFRLTNNYLGAVTTPANGAGSPIASAVEVVHAGDAGYSVKSYLRESNLLFIVGTVLGAENAAAEASTSPFTVAQIQVGSSLLASINSVTCVIAGLAGGERFYFSNTTTDYYVWYTLDGAGADPAVAGRTGIKVAVLSTDSNAIVAQKTREALNGWAVYDLTLNAAASISSSDYWVGYSATATTPQKYAIWYEKDGAGDAPVVADAILIKVAIITGDTAAQVVLATQIAINSYSYSVLDARGYFIRAWDNGAAIDPDAATRWSMVPGVIGDEIGTFQLSENISHYHIPESGSTEFTTIGNAGARQAPAPGSDLTEDPQTGSTGGYESRGINLYLNAVIKY
ncbi:MAG: hypothetical protein A3E87_01615 [Gammaproteobacteria bacterium RIFCSPHIGHO2_12_FULL_35_23]|nr:MAG: hypothetical protein A3E87_01615 [Gammaproteobacteria bacterium RIFCSPHIGHO2_12_FULL_35_23]